MLQTEARPAEHRADAGRSTAPATGGCDGHSALRPSWHSVIPHDRNSAMVSDNGLRPMIPDDHGRAMITHDGWRAMVSDHETAAIVAAVASRRSVVGGNENQTGGERDGNSGRCCDTSFHEWAPLLQVRSLRRAPSGICERDHRQNVSAFAAWVRAHRRWASKSDRRRAARLRFWNVSFRHGAEVIRAAASSSNSAFT